MIRYANVDGQLREPATGLKGICTGCGNSLIAKCGRIKINHWAHKQLINCDPWWEPMTQWHLNWQDKFASEWREVILRDEQSGEYHRADIHTPQGLTIEFQHSVLSLDELERRNNFYKKLIWVVDVKQFKEEIIFTSTTPNPQSPFLAKYNFSVDSDGLAKSLQFYLKDEYRNFGPAVRTYSYNLNDPEFRLVAEEHDKNQKQYWLFNWKNKRRAWLNSNAPVFLDFGDELLYWIKKRTQWHTPLLYLQVVKKGDFLVKYGSQRNE